MPNGIVGEGNVGTVKQNGTRTRNPLIQPRPGIAYWISSVCDGCV